MAPRQLTPKQARFVAEYLVDCNATAAAIRAGYSKRTADRIGPELLGKTWVAEAVHAAMQRRAEAVGVSADLVVRELARVAFVDPRKVFTFGPTGVSLVDSETLTDDVAATVAEASQSISAEGGSIRVKLHDKLKALELLGRHLGMWNDKLDLNADWSDLARRLAEGRDRVSRRG